MTFPASPNDTVEVVPGSGLTDAQGNIWTINSGQVEEIINPNAPDQSVVIDTLTSNVDAVALVNGVIWQQAHPGGGAASFWWAKTGTGYDGWGTQTSTDPLPTSPDGTIIGSTTNALVDGSGNLWSLQNGQVIENGTADTGTGNVLEMAYKGGFVWQEAKPSWSTQPLWWAKTGGPGNYDGWTSGPGTNNSNGTVTAPVPVPRAWIGGGNNLASNPADWSPTSVPKAGDTLSMTSGQTMNVVDNALAGDTVMLNGNSTNAPETINLSGNVNMSVGSGDNGWGPATVNLAEHTNWIGSAGSGPYGSGVTISGSPSSQWQNVSSYIDNSEVVGVNVTGTGKFTSFSAHHQATLEFMHGVGSGQTVDVDGYVAYGGEYGVVQVDDPKNFNAAVDLGFGEVNLKGLAADSYNIKGDLLTLFDNNHVVDTMKLTIEPLQSGSGSPSFGVSMVAGLGVSVHADGHYADTALPIHS